MIQRVFLILSILYIANSTTISFIFIGGHSEQLQAAEILQKSNYKATFYLNSKYLGFVENYINVFQADDLYNAGFDIGGNTYSNVEFSPSTPITTITEEICRDRATLIANGWQPRSFAYVDSFYNSITQQIVKDCGYRTSLVSSTISIDLSIPSYIALNQPYYSIPFVSNSFVSNSFDSNSFDSNPFDSKLFISNTAFNWLIFNIEKFTPNDMIRFTELIEWLSTSTMHDVRKFDDVLNDLLDDHIDNILPVPQSFQNTPSTPTPDRDGFIKMIIGCACFGILIAMILYVSIHTQCKRSKCSKCCSKSMKK